MMELTGQILVPEVSYSLLGVLGLLVIWQFHQNQVLAGRIYAVDFWDIAGIRMFVHATVQDGRACPTCEAADGYIFLPSLATRRNFSTLHGACTSARGCRCLIVALYGGWPEANHLIQVLRKRSRTKAMRLSEGELQTLFKGPWEKSVTSAGDRLTLLMLEAMQLEGGNHQKAVALYRIIIKEASGARDLRLVAPAYLRLAEVVEGVEGPEAALRTIEEFERRFARRRKVFYYPTESQRDVLASRKFRLESNLRRTCVYERPRQQISMAG